MPESAVNPALQHVRWEIDYDIHLGATWGRFMDGLREQRLLANRCPSCQRTFVPPQSFCEACFERTDEWLELDPVGEVETFTVVQQGFRGGPKPPYAVAAIRIDCASTMLMHFLGGIDLSDPAKVRDQLPEGRRVQAVWASERAGSILDIAHFAPESAR
ncbi:MULTISPECIES: Zn-ribbon domain-containing OB-fold protein [unclassified Mycobacterium]|uniref:Zn-ribbon domain-containing OB-fold protein n=1 Tax=unclassified Mycobacterium TaxID=2642494 RepID=UPI00048AD359|nr:MULTISPECIES: Zn-ribbon domain-containing OB-fold protein [unclassified Mycobacterium]SEA61959.1 hypothetical protein SAMN04488580_103465 [Mycobacterium sp. 283mftsu]